MEGLRQSLTLDTSKTSLSILPKGAYSFVFRLIFWFLPITDMEREIAMHTIIHQTFPNIHQIYLHFLFGEAAHPFSLALPSQVGQSASETDAPACRKQSPGAFHLMRPGEETSNSEFRA